MSYILDALKKAEADSDPSLRSSLLLAQPAQRNPRLQALVIAVLVLNAAVLIWLFGPWSETAVAPLANLTPAATTGTPPASREPGPSPNPEPAGTTAAPAGSAASAQPQPLAAAPADPPAVATAPVAAPPRPAPAPAGRVLTETTLGNLPTAARARFPGLTFSTHIYADDPSLRAVVVNGERLTEGERLGALRLDGITEEGVVFEFERWLVAVSVFDSWN